jgi:hypothetical protein
MPATALGSPVVAPSGSAASSATQTCPHCGDQAPAAALFCEGCGYDFTTGALPVTSPLDLAPSASPLQPLPAPAPPEPSSAPPGKAWVAEIWVDAEWYRNQPVTPEDPLPSAGLPRIIALRGTSVLIGRPSKSKGITPDIDCSPDSSVSRRQAQLTTDGQRWWVHDLDSANGTFVAAATEALPTTPVPANERRELAEGDRLYVGAWCRLILREALPGEA